MTKKSNWALALASAASIYLSIIPTVSHANSPTPKSFAGKSTDDISIICSRRLKTVAEYAALRIPLVENDLLVARMMLQQALTLDYSVSNFNMTRAIELYRWMLTLPEDEHSRQLNWCSEVADTIYANVSRRAKLKIDGLAEQELTKLIGGR